MTTIAAAGTVASWVCGLPVPFGEVLTVTGVGGAVAARTKYLSARHSIMKKHPMAYLYEMRKAADGYVGLPP